MKSVKIITLGMLIALFIGCNKDEKDSDTVRMVRKIEYYQDSDGVATTTVEQSIEYRYDAQNRIAEVIVTARNSIKGNVFYNYPAENVMIASVTEPPYGSITYALNNDGSLISMSEGDQLKQIWTYANGYLQKTETYSVFGSIPVTNTETYTWENGNVKTSLLELLFSSDPPSKYSLNFTYEYGSLRNKPSSIDFGRYYVGVPRGWYGKSVQNILSKTTLKREDGSQDVTSYRYETDKKGFPLKIFMQEGGNSEALRVTIEYAN